MSVRIRPHVSLYLFVLPQPSLDVRRLIVVDEFLQLGGNLHLKHLGKFRSSHMRNLVPQMRRCHSKAWPGASSWPSSNSGFWAAPSTSYHVILISSSRNTSMVRTCHVRAMMKKAVNMLLHAWSCALASTCLLTFTRKHTKTCLLSLNGVRQPILDIAQVLHQVRASMPCSAPSTGDHLPSYDSYMQTTLMAVTMNYIGLLQLRLPIS